MKKKSSVLYASKRSGKNHNGYWLPQGPFGNNKNNYVLKQYINDNINNNNVENGFSINGGHRNIGYVGQDSKFSKSGTPFKGTLPSGHGGKYGSYATPLSKSNVNKVITLGNQYKFIKPSVLTNRGMLRKKYKWVYYGSYPNYWVQPLNTGNLIDNNSSSLYTELKSIQHNTTNITNLNSKYYNDIYNKNLKEDNDNQNLCSSNYNNNCSYNVNNLTNGIYSCKNKSIVGKKYNNIVQNTKNSKTLKSPLDSSLHTSIQKYMCSNNNRLTYPYSVQNGTSLTASGTNVSSGGNACNTSNTYKLEPTWFKMHVSNKKKIFNSRNTRDNIRSKYE